MNYQVNKFSAAFLAQYQSEVLRRDSDDPTGLTSYRPESVPSWTNVDMRIAYKLFSNMEIGLIGNNLLDSEQFIIRNAPDPFDYKRNGSSIMADILFKF